ncbi:hypothetical protein ABGB12_20235 [Actinocorallia sp. B10E7]|uniref:hypothetical protein n=1 Tax=Actinocorallia sp. B10E7 TaxID=3153558 RepID=UPI00325D5146
MRRSWALFGLLFTVGCSAFGWGGRELKPGSDAAAWVEPDQRTVLISTLGGACEESAKVKVQETSETVEIRVTVRSSDGPCVMVGIPRAYKVVLREALGSRKLVGGDAVEYPRAEQRPVEGSAEYKIPVEVEYD